MPTISRTIDIIFNGIDQTTGAAQSVIGNIEGLDDAVVSVAEPIADVTKGLLALEAAALAVAFALGKSAYDAAVQFESAQIDLAKVLSDTDGDVEQFTDRVIELSNTYGQSSTALLQAIADFKQAGFTAQDSAQLVEDALVLASAGQLEAAESSEILTRTLKGYNAEAEEAGRITDILNEVSNQYATDVRELGNALAAVAPITSTLGFSLEETVGLLTPIIERFGSGAEAATALRTGLNRLISPVNTVQEALAALGVAQEDANGNLRTAPDILRDVQLAFGGLTDTQQQFFTQQLVGVEQSGRLVSVFQNLERTTEITNVALNSTGSALLEAAAQLESAQSAADRTSAAFENLQIAVGTELREPLSGIVDAFGDILRAGEDAVRNQDALAALFDGLEPLIREVEEALRDFAEALPEGLAQADFQPFVEAFDTLLSLFRGSDLNSAEGIAEAITNIGEAFRTLSQFTVGAVGFFQNLASVLSPLVDLFTSLDGETAKTLGTIGGISLIVGPAVSIFNALAGALGGLAKLGGIAGAVGNAASLTTLGQAIGRLAGPLGIGLLTFELTKLTGAGDAVNEAFGPGEDSLGTWIFGLLNDGPKAADAVDRVTVSAERLVELEEKFKPSDDPLGLTGVTEAAAEADEAVKQITFTAAEYQEALDATVPTIDELTAAQQAAEDSARGWRVEVIDGVATYEQVGTAAGKALQNAEDATKNAREETEKAREAAQDYQLKLEELASNERIRSLEAKVSLDIAEVEANAEVLVATFDSLSETINSTGSLISDLFSLDELPEWDRFGFDVQRQIERENELRQQAAEDQSRLTQAQIDALRARTRALERGDALIEISGDGLEPELEAFMWAILRRIQVRANADGAEFLLGIA